MVETRRRRVVFKATGKEIDILYDHYNPSIHEPVIEDAPKKASPNVKPDKAFPGHKKKKKRGGKR